MVTLNGIDIHYELRGEESAPRTLFVNGSGATLERTGALIDVFASRLRIACHDQRGLGRTEIPTGPFTMAEYAADALALADHLGWSRFRMIGLSFGGMVAQEIAVTAPQRIERLALVCTSPGGAGGSSYPLHELVGLDPDERANRYRRLLDTRFTDEWLQEHSSDRALVEMMGTQTGRVASDEVRRGEWEQLQARRGHDVWDRLHCITCPTLVASGRYDGIAPASNGAAIASRIPHADHREYDGGHAFFIQDRRAVPDLIHHLSGPTGG